MVMRHIKHLVHLAKFGAFGKTMAIFFNVTSYFGKVKKAIKGNSISKSVNMLYEFWGTLVELVA